MPKTPIILEFKPRPRKLTKAKSFKLNQTITKYVRLGGMPQPTSRLEFLEGCVV